MRLLQRDFDWIKRLSVRNSKDENAICAGAITAGANGVARSSFLSPAECPGSRRRTNFVTAGLSQAIIRYRTV